MKDLSLFLSLTKYIYSSLDIIRLKNKFQNFNELVLQK
jgi:hypothetical protein